MSEVIDLNEKRTEKNPVYYTVHYAHDKDGFSFTCEGIANDPESNKRLAYYMRKAAEIFEAQCKGNNNE